MSGVGALPAKVVLLEIALEARHGSTVDQKRKTLCNTKSICSTYFTYFSGVIFEKITINDPLTEIISVIRYFSYVL